MTKPSSLLPESTVVTSYFLYKIVSGETNFFDIFRWEIIWRFQHFMNWFWQYFGKIKKGGNYWMGEILQGRILIKEIQEIWSAHPMVWRILFSRIPNIFHQICFLFWSHPNWFMDNYKKITKKLMIFIEKLYNNK